MLVRHLSFVSLCVLGLSSVAQAKMSTEAAAKLAPNVQSRIAALDASYDVIVYLKGEANLDAAKTLKAKEARTKFIYDALVGKANESQRGVLSMLSAESTTRYQRFHIANAIAVTHASRALVEALAERSDVQRIVANRPSRGIPNIEPAQLVPDGVAAIGDNIRKTGADQVWAMGHKGEGLVIAGNDTGIEWTHPGLKSHYRGWDGMNANHAYNWHDAVHESVTGFANPCGYDTEAPCDDNAHGTHTIGTTVGDDGVGNQIGMAPGAKWIGCRNMDAGVGKPSTYLECFEFFLAPYPHGGNPMTDGRPELAPDVINNSWGCPADEGCDGAEFLTALNALREAGIMVVAAAGNDGSACSTIKDAPAHHTDEVLVVGAFDHRNDTVASFSSRGPSRFDAKVSPDTAAPGVNVRSSIPGGTYSGSLWSGTSMASPHVAGAVALLWSARPELKNDVAATTALFRDTSTPKTSTQTCAGRNGGMVPNNTYGNGLMNVLNATNRR